MAAAWLRVTPTYGYGWRASKDGSAREIPEPFSMRLGSQSNGAWAGIIHEPGHEFHGHPTHLSRRHGGEWDGQVNVVVEGAATGFGVLGDPLPSA